MKKFSKILALMLALVMCVSMLAACKSEEEKKAEPANAIEENGNSEKVIDETPEEVTERIATEFMDSYIACDHAVALSYCDGDAKETIQYVKDRYDELTDEEKKEFKEKFGKYAYKVAGVEVDGDATHASITFEMTMDGVADDNAVVEMEKINNNWVIVNLI